MIYCLVETLVDEDISEAAVVSLLEFNSNRAISYLSISSICGISPYIEIQINIS